jgi:hypothetical protein
MSISTTQMEEKRKEENREKMSESDEIPFDNQATPFTPP